MKIKTITVQSFPTVVTATEAQVGSINVLPGESASGAVTVGNLDEAGNFQQVAGWTVAMTPAQYALWGTDDSYAVSCFLTNLGIEPT